MQWSAAYSAATASQSVPSGNAYGQKQQPASIEEIRTRCGSATSSTGSTSPRLLRPRRRGAARVDSEIRGIGEDCHYVEFEVLLNPTRLKHELPLLEMEPAIIDWKNIDSEYVADELYEHIDAPKWLDLSGASPPAIDDDTYFCLPDCRHPKTAEDFLTRPPSPKVTPLGERKSNSQSSKRGGRIAALLPSPSLRELPKSKPKANAKKLFFEDLENRDPNLLSAAATANNGATATKEAVKTSSDKGVAEEEEEEAELIHKKPLPPRLKSKLSARNLFSRDILRQLSEFCHEIKKMAGVREKPTKKGESNVEEKKVLLESSPKKIGRVTLKVQIGEGENKSVLREVREGPPTPQRFPSPSSGRRLRSNKAAAAASTSSSPLHKPTKSSTLVGDHGRGILQELLDQSGEKNRTLAAKDEEFGTSVASDREGSFAEMFWFFKPCTHLVK